jgi:hypothetical protein
MSDVHPVVSLIQDSVRAGSSLAEAEKKLLAIGLPGPLIKEALASFAQQTGRIRTLREPTSLEKRGLAGWYTGPDMNRDRFWPALRRYLEERGRPEEVISSIDTASNKILSLIPPSGLGAFHTRGLVVGYVQSGKTANFTAVISKAADVQYKLFIVLSGITNPLRSQTQQRLERELVTLNPEHWVSLTTADQDFSARSVGNAAAFLTDHGHQRILCVVKKNASVLRRLLKWLNSAPTEIRNNCPVLIIDDEADQASVNASSDPERITIINGLLRNLIKTLPKVAYIGYTATPFANVLIDPSHDDDFYPRDFIIDLPRPDAYFGPETIFGRDPLTPDEEESQFDGLNMIRRVPDDEVSVLKPHGRNDWQTFEPALSPSLRESLRYFWLATAARWARGQQRDHSTMLIHTTLYSEVQERFRFPVDQYRQELLRQVQRGHQELQISLRRLWEREQAEVLSESMGESTTTFEDLLPYLASVLERTTVIIENSRSHNRLVFPEEGSIQVVIGGNTLARGLTLEGLVVSYFIRAATAYDTLLQMGRWFGYRKGYADLPRIWMTGDLEESFKHLALVEEEIRQDIRRYQIEGRTPLDFAIRIRTHKSLMVTSPLKMQKAIECQISYAASRIQTVLFRHNDQPWLQQNLDASEQLITMATRLHGKPTVLRNNRLFLGIPALHILEFLKNYNIERSGEMEPALIQKYITAQNKQGALGSWTVGIVGLKESSAAGIMDITPNLVVPLITRSRLKTLNSVENIANLGVLTSKVDLVADVPQIAQAEVQKRSTADLIQLRHDQGKTDGLLLLYPIAKDSRPRRADASADDRPSFKEGEQKIRVPLNAAEHLIGLSIVFPPTSMLTPQSYVTADLSKVDREELEISEEEAEE